MSREVKSQMSKSPTSKKPFSPSTLDIRPSTSRLGIDWSDPADRRRYYADYRETHRPERRAENRRAWRKKRARVLDAYADYIARRTGVYRERVLEMIKAYEEAKKTKGFHREP